MNWKSLVLVSLLVLGVAAGAGAEMKVAAMDLDAVFNAHPKTKAAEAELKQAEEEIEAEMESLMAEARALDEQAAVLRDAARSPMLTEEARARKRAEAEEKLQELQDFQLSARRKQETKMKQLQAKVMASRQDIVDEMMALVALVSKEEGWDLVLDRSGLTMNMIPLVVYSAPELDVTQVLIERLGGGE